MKQVGTYLTSFDRVICYIEHWVRILLLLHFLLFWISSQSYPRRDLCLSYGYEKNTRFWRTAGDEITSTRKIIQTIIFDIDLKDIFNFIWWMIIVQHTIIEIVTYRIVKSKIHF